MALLQNLPVWLVAATWQGSLVIAFVWCLRPVVRRLAGAQAAHALWILVLLKLLSPWQPLSPVNLLPWQPDRAIIPQQVATSWSVVSVSVQQPQTETAPAAPALAHAASPRWPLILWLGGAVCILACNGLRIFRASRIVKKGVDISHDPLIRKLRDSFPDWPRRLRIVQTIGPGCPALAGFWNPIILLPQDWKTQWNHEELRCIFAHETGHLCRGDLLWRWAFLLATALHWFNPLVWLSQRSTRADQEMACDEWVLNRHLSVDAQRYGEILLKAIRLADGLGLRSPVHARMAESRSRFKRRIRHLAQIRTHGWPAALCTGLVICGLAILIGPAQAEEKSSEILVKTTPGEQPAKPQENAESPFVESHEVEIEARFIEINGKLGDTLGEMLGLVKSPPDLPHSNNLNGVFTEMQYQKVLQQFGQMKNVDLLTAPRVVVKSGQHAVIEITREFRYPAEYDPATTTESEPAPGQTKGMITKIPVTPAVFETRNVGVTLEVTPQILDDQTLMIKASTNMVDFEGFINYGSNVVAPAVPNGDALQNVLNNQSPAENTINQPIFSTRRITTSVSMQRGQTILIGGISKNEERTLSDKTPKGIQTTREEFQKYAIIFITSRLVEATKSVAPKPTTPSAFPRSTTQPSTNLPFGIPVAGNPGFIKSPHAPEKGYVDGRGFPKGTEIKCPYTGKTFLVL